MFGLSFLALSQGAEFMHGVGFSHLYVLKSGELNNGTYGITYAPRLAFTSRGESSLSLNINATLGFSGALDSRDDSNWSLSYELPIAIDYNFGYQATRKSNASTGGFLGLGYGVTNIQNTVFAGFTGVDEADKVRGLYGEFGGRFKIQTFGMREENEDPVSFSFSIYTIRGKNSNIVGVRIIMALK